MITKIIDESHIVDSKDLIDDAERIAIIAHAAPDGDAVGSAMAMYHFLFSIDKEAVVIFPDPFPAFLNFIPSVDKALYFKGNEEQVKTVCNEVDLIICVDFNDLSRLGGVLADVVRNSKTPKLMIDHHPDPIMDAWTVAISYPRFASTSEIVFRLICRMGYAADINKFCAECIYTGMMTDTGNFTYNSNDVEMYYIVGELVRRGVNKDEIYRKVNVYSADRMRLMGHLLINKMRIYPEYQAAMIDLSLVEQEQFNFQRGDSEGFVNIPLSIDGINISVFFKEETEKIKVSLRSRGDIAVNSVASKFYRGGGHLNAAGGEIYGSTLQSVVDKFERLILKEFNLENK